ncbi:TatD family hydrolase [Pleomorphomonas sp. JP5]|uniref:TatD family hydrolase n=1 Tax=Pleomorphomonas sp. JP5 TaxID=2942998 RepID=UPI0020442E15|nr:TatD family hydrolase [Pleomorphomonas sp. JP5]MCM5560132.1 TatD family hydrolase [Pleomorphomonas sp. JP5]
MIVDSHCHLDFSDFAGEADALLARAAAADVHVMVTIGTRVRDFDKVRAIAEAHRQVYCTVGTHPHEAEKEADVGVEELVSLASHPKVIGIGEAGLDYFYDSSPRDVQAEVFRRHIAAARITGLPLCIHSRDADDDMIAILEEETGKGAFPILLHCFSSGRELMERSVALGAFISFSGILTFKRSDELRAIARDVPADRLLVETDAPYLAPLPWRGKRNEPAYVAHTAKVLAEVKGVPPAEMAETTTANFARLFAKVPREVFA